MILQKYVAMNNYSRHGLVVFSVPLFPKETTKYSGYMFTAYKGTHRGNKILRKAKIKKWTGVKYAI